MPVTSIQRTSLTPAPPDTPMKSAIPVSAPVFGQPVPISQVIARAPATSDPAPATRPASAPAGDLPAAGGIDLEDLARRLFEPVSRLLRADLRQGRERAGRAHDRRR
jgi:hypothetical protein